MYQIQVVILQNRLKRDSNSYSLKISPPKEIDFTLSSAQKSKKNVCWRYVFPIGFVNLLQGPRRDLMLICLQEKPSVNTTWDLISTAIKYHLEADKTIKSEHEWLKMEYGNQLWNQLWRETKDLEYFKKIILYILFKAWIAEVFSKWTWRSMQNSLSSEK